jgi:hypothetical protein
VFRKGSFFTVLPGFKITLDEGERIAI